ncbi:MAG: hypothetical protein ACRDQA_08715 [Nocardioidaceae bacterium]
MSVWYDVVVWCDGHIFFWRQGEPYQTHPAQDPSGAADRVAARVELLRGLGVGEF